MLDLTVQSHDISAAFFHVLVWVFVKIGSFKHYLNVTHQQ